MPRFFFHIDNRPSETDDEGVDLPNAEAARNQALSYLGEILKDQGLGLSFRHLPLRIRVTDTTGATIVSLAVSEVEKVKAI
jgi:hypothetical protein